jgi:hypothetical protein
MTTDALLACAGDAHCRAAPWDLARELARRQTPAQLLPRLKGAPPAKSRVIVFALYQFDRDDAAAAEMRRQLKNKDDEVRYYALHFLARRCDAEALEALSAKPYKPRAACTQWADTILQFGQCKYRRATPLLLESLDHVCGNVTFSADMSLRSLYPGAPAKFDSPAKEKAYFEGRANQGK